MTEFEKLVNEFVKPVEKKTETLEQKLERLKKEQACVEARLAEEKKREAEAKKEREIIIRYIPDEPASAKVIKGAEFMEPGKPDNVVAMLDAAAGLMADANGINRYLLMERLLNALVNSIEAQMLVKEILR